MKNIALIYGGNSAEHEVSVQSGKNVANNIDRTKYNIHEVLVKGTSWSVVNKGDSPIEINKDDFSYLLDGEKVTFDKVLMMIHGTPGENGLLEGYFEMLGIPCTASSSFASAITFDKYACKSFLRDTGVNLAKDHFLRKGESYNKEEIIDKLGLPLFVKPCDGGSSFGVTKVKSVEEFDDAIAEATREWESVIIEEFIPGREFNQGIYTKAGELLTLPITEIITENEFFDYQAKYLGKSNEVCPAPISNDLVERISEITKKIYFKLGCKGCVRVDYIVSGDKIYFLECNTIPGMTKMSLVPQQVAAASLDFTDFLTTLIEEA
ncbi:MAG: D-alanine--D-alanine ligase [Bacteroidales bacterium]|nr:D-alanine--D-alanine ligase [Bacteroidales bacterium]